MERRIHFNQLPEELREQLVRNLNKSGPCSPLFEDQLSATMNKWAAGLWGGAGLMMLSIIALHDFGELFGGLQHPVWILGYGISSWFVCYGGLKLLRSSRLQQNLPFKPGVYLFPLDLLDARDSVLRITPTSAVSRVEIEHSESDDEYSHSVLTLIMEDGTTAPMKVNGRSLVYDLSSSFETQRSSAQRALAQGDTESLATLDPFLSIRLHPQGWDKYSEAPVKVSHGPRAKDLLTPFHYIKLFALVLALGVAPLLWAGRHYLSDGDRFEQALTAPLVGPTDRAQAMEIYLDGGFRHRQAVLDEHLPKAMLDVALSKNSATALREFLATSPPPQYKALAEAALHQRFAAALNTFKTQANPNHPEALALMTTLLDYMEREGAPPVDVTFMSRSPEPRSPEQARRMSALTDAHLTHIERAVASRLQRFFLFVAPRDILAINHAPRLAHAEPKAAEDLDKTIAALRFPRPTLLISYILRPADARLSQDDDASAPQSLGVALDLNVSWHIPGIDEPSRWSTTLKLTAHDDTFDLTFLDTSLEAASPDHVASAHAFYRFTNELLGFFFDKKSLAGKRLTASGGFGAD